MATLTVRIDRDTHKALRELSGQTGVPMSVVISKVVQEYQRQHFLGV